jgi:hypothetical protein
MNENKTKETIEEVFNAFILEMEVSELSHHLISIYRELGIEP